MTFEELKQEIYSCNGMTFAAASDRLQGIVFALNKADTLELISQIGAIPEDVGHDSTEEKLYTKTSDILLAKSLLEMNMEAKVMTQRSDCADVIAQSHYHGYSLVGDAKVFRLSRTARNAKDYKVNSMSVWRGDSDYSVLVCPYFQYPRRNSRIYKEALSDNVTLFSWEYLYILLKRGVKETPTVDVSNLWKQSEIIGNSTVVSNAKACFLSRQNANIARILGISIEEFRRYFNAVKDIIMERGVTEIQYYEQEIERIKQLDREEAISELLERLKLGSKISTIRNFLDQIRERDMP